jgi:probable HAF family extracellular repeat protein
MQNLGTLDGGSAQAYGINNNGQIVGDSTTANSGYNSFAFLYSGGVMQNLGATGGLNTGAYGINDNGQIVGSFDTITNVHVPHAFLYSGGTIQDLGSLGGDAAGALGINNNGQIVGYASLSNNAQHAFLYSVGVMHDLGTLGGDECVAQAINTQGQIVGWSYLPDPNSTVEHAIFCRNGVMVDLNTLIPANSGWTLEEALAINDLGQIAGYGINSNGQEHAFLLTPSPAPSGEPLLPTWGVAGLLLGVATFGMGFLARRTSPVGSGLL